MNKYKSIFISDVHLGSKECKASELTSFLKKNSADKLFLVGDIIDGWKIKRKKWRWDKKHSNVIRQLLKHSKKSQITYVAGNHDEFLRPFINLGIDLYNIKIVNQCDYIDTNGKKYIVTHGDLFDGISRMAPMMSFLGDWAYDRALQFNNWFNYVRHRMGFGYWSLSKFLKHKVKGAVQFIFDFENNLVGYAKKRSYDGVICGHIHHAEIKDIEGTIYMNTGDWVESLTALVEHHDGRWEIIEWKEKDEENTSSN